MILMEPFLLMTLHFSHIGFTEDLTFILNLLSERMRLLRTKVRILVYYYADLIARIILFFYSVPFETFRIPVTYLSR